ncbi:hypothetical protein B0J13DRAFT_459298 [Dactylonectria estremocensis]|uniref:Smr domain-containing protein n=1 Tax=Dactylonectria estremocensis TaxID=1079267 RepID=A0A9P9DC33_9HYPO|nr:hypothetical protein B0J13DRAFT_459298 [Dactylonectria estremocensis]
MPEPVKATKEVERKQDKLVEKVEVAKEVDEVAAREAAEAEESFRSLLVESFRSLLDEALIVAIASDYDLTKESGYQSAKNILEELVGNVSSGEAAGISPSGIAEGPNEMTDSSSTTEITNSQDFFSSNDADTTDTDLTSLTSGGLYRVPELTTFDDENEDSKFVLLQSMFIEIKEYDIKHSLKKANGDFQAALDDLLTIQYLKATGQEKKGVDGFFNPEGDSVEGGKKSRRRKKGKKPLVNDNMNTANMATSSDVLKDKKRQDEIAYLADRLDLPFNKVSDIYCQKRFAIGATAVEILDQHISLGIEAQDDESKRNTTELADKYRNVPEHYIATIVQITSSISQWADDIAALLSKHFAKNSWTQKLPMDYALTPLLEEDLEEFETISPSKAAASKIFRQPAPQPADRITYTQVVEEANQYTRARREAAQLSLRGASNPLYRQAAGYYAGLGREQSRYEEHLFSTAADNLVDGQSTPSTIDLHGVYVQDGVRIAKARVQSWWDALGESRSEEASQQPLTVITGLGRHSAGGASQLRQGVAAALLQEGWKMRVETGRFVVTGRR